jgi:hypothetical protein
LAAHTLPTANRRIIKAVKTNALFFIEIFSPLGYEIYLKTYINLFNEKIGLYVLKLVKKSRKYMKINVKWPIILKKVLKSSDMMNQKSMKDKFLGFWIFGWKLN